MKNSGLLLFFFLQTDNMSDHFWKFPKFFNLKKSTRYQKLSRVPDLKKIWKDSSIHNWHENKEILKKMKFPVLTAVKIHPL